MNIGAIIAATVLVAAVGLFIGVFLGVAGKKFAVEVDEKEVAVREHFPVITAVAVVIPAVMAWQQQSPKVRHL